MSFDLLIGGIQTVLQPQTLLFLAIGCFVGMVVGVLPGLGASAGIAILLPLTFGMDPTSAIVMLAAIYYGCMYGGTLTSVLINTPGESSAVATTFDGYPLARQGRAGAVLVLCAVGSAIAGTLGALGVTVLSPWISDRARGFGPSEMFLLVCLGLLMIIVIVGGNRLYGAISVMVGFAIATIGSDLASGVSRFTMGSADLINGVEFVPIAIGVFGLGEVFYAVYEGRQTQAVEKFDLNPARRGFWPRRSEWRDSWLSMGRGSVIGFFLGTLPGAGATTATLVSYGVEKSVSKTPEKFGKGAVAGVVGPESSNNAASAGAMIPLLSLGIPGSGSTAVLLGGFIMWGLLPGPLLMTNHPDFAWGLIASMYLGNLMLVVVSIFAIPFFASFMKVPYRIAAPTIVVLCMVGTYAINGSVLETGIMLASGLLGLFMKIYGFSPAGLVLAVILGPLAEKTLRQSLQISNGDWGIFVDRPISLVLTIIIGAILTLTGINALRRAVLARRRAVLTPEGVLSDE